MQRRSARRSTEDLAEQRGWALIGGVGGTWGGRHTQERRTQPVGREGGSAMVQDKMRGFFFDGAKNQP